MKLIHWGGWLAAVALAIPVAVTLPNAPFVPPPVAAEATATPHIKIIGASGTGSGVAIGNRYILTAGHVATMNDKLTAKDSLGRTHNLTVLWVNTGKDVALLRLDDDVPVASAPLSCDAPVIGQHVKAYGNPLSVENVYASGSIVGAPIQYGPWESVITLDVTIVPGMSGGALVNDAGQVVGIDVGVMVYGALTGFGYSVPSIVVCELLGKA